MPCRPGAPPFRHLRASAGLAADAGSSIRQAMAVQARWVYSTACRPPPPPQARTASSGGCGCPPCRPCCWPCHWPSRPSLPMPAATTTPPCRRRSPRPSPGDWRRARPRRCAPIRAGRGSNTRAWPATWIPQTPPRCAASCSATTARPPPPRCARCGWPRLRGASAGAISSPTGAPATAPPCAAPGSTRSRRWARPAPNGTPKRRRCGAVASRNPTPATPPSSPWPRAVAWTMPCAGSASTWPWPKARPG